MQGYGLVLVRQEQVHASVQVPRVQHPLAVQQVLESLQQVQQLVFVLVSVAIFCFLLVTSIFKLSVELEALSDGEVPTGHPCLWSSTLSSWTGILTNASMLSAPPLNSSYRQIQDIACLS